MTAAYRFLHIEDSPDDAELVKVSLRKAPFTHSTARVDREAGFTAALDAGIPDAILCDYDMPEFSAERALAILQERALDVPFIIVSAHIGESAAVIAMQNGASDYISKRDLGRLPKAIEAAIDRSNSRREQVRVQEALRASESMKRSVLNSLDSRIAVLDGEGVILAVNQPWQRFDAVRTEMGLGNAVEGGNYLAILRQAAEQGSPFAQAGVEAIRSVIAREKAFASIEYQVSFGNATRWYLARATPLEGTTDGAVISHTDITDRMMAHVALEGTHRRLQMLSTRVLSIQENERRTVAGELHDDIGQSLTALKISLHRLTLEPGAANGELLAQSLQIAESTLERLREMVHALRPPQLDQLGLADALGWLVERQRKATGLEIGFAPAGLEGRRPPAAIEVACYRIAQEGINNATRHADATRIDVGLESDGHLLKLTVRDNGVGFDEEAVRQAAVRSGSLGLVSMEERARLAGGRLKLRTVIGGGTTMSAVFPLQTADSVPSEAALDHS